MPLNEERQPEDIGRESLAAQDYPDSSLVDTCGQTSIPAAVRRHLLLALAVAALGSILGIIGSVIQEARADFLAVFFAGPMIEEAMKPAGLYLLLLWRPVELQGLLRRALLGAVAGLSFGLMESWVYVNLYVSAPTHQYVLFRFTVPVLVHATASAIFAMGITPRLLASVRGEVPFLSGSWPFFVAAAVLHSAYNITVTLLGIFTNTLSF